MIGSKASMDSEAPGIQTTWSLLLPRALVALTGWKAAHGDHRILHLGSCDSDSNVKPWLALGQGACNNENEDGRAAGVRTSVFLSQ